MISALLKLFTPPQQGCYLHQSEKVTTKGFPLFRVITAKEKRLFSEERQSLKRLEKNRYFYDS